METQVDWAQHKGLCPMCGHKNCFYPLKGKPEKWICFYSGHKGGGRKSKNGLSWWGDQKDVTSG
jgi:hypothetical protein